MPRTEKPSAHALTGRKDTAKWSHSNEWQNQSLAGQGFGIQQEIGMTAKHKTNAAKYLPIEINDVDTAFCSKAMQILLPYDAIPDEFKRASNPWVKWSGDWFFKGLDRYPVANDGIDLSLAMRNLNAVQRSFELKHEHKEACVAYLASLWFSSQDGEPIAKTSQ